MALLYPEECYKINGALYEVHKELGPGLLEKVYQEALEKELRLQGIPFERERQSMCFIVIRNSMPITLPTSCVMVRSLSN